MVRISLVIPAWNEEALLPRLLDTVDVARAHYRAGVDAVEVIVADNISTDATAKIAQERKCRVVRVEKRVIAAVRNGGAAVARGEILAFIDADSRIHPETFNAIDDEMTRPIIVAGATGVRPERMSLGLAVTWAIMIPFVVMLRIDAGVVFCRRLDFETIGGYDESRLFAEDVDFLVRMKKLGRLRRQRLTRALGVKAIASNRKFDKFGHWHYLTQFARLSILMLWKRDAADEFAQRYWYEDER